MTEDKVKKAAQNLIHYLETENYYDSGGKANLTDMRAFKALKASLTPSRSEIADKLCDILDYWVLAGVTEDDTLEAVEEKEFNLDYWISHAITELRKGESK